MNTADRLEWLKRYFLEHPDGATTQELAARLDVDQRTIQRDLERLQAEPLYIPLYREGWNWKLVEGHLYQLPPLTLTLHQGVALYLAGRLLARYSDEHNPHIVAALQKLGTVLPPMAAQQVHHSAQRLTYRRERPRVTHALEALAEGWVHHRQVRIHYYGADDPHSEIRETILDPYLLEPSSWGLATYVIGHSSRHDDVRTFKVERVQAATLLATSFVPPRDLDLAALLESAWNVMYGATTERVALRFAPGVTRRVSESTWHPSQTFEPLPDGGCRVTFEIAFPHEMKPWIRQWGRVVTIEAPTWLRQEIERE